MLLKPWIFSTRFFIRAFLKAFPKKMRKRMIEEDLTEIFIDNRFRKGRREKWERKTSAEFVKVIKKASFSDLHFYSSFKLFASSSIPSSTEQRSLSFVKNVILDFLATSVNFSIALEFRGDDTAGSNCNLNWVNFHELFNWNNDYRDYLLNLWAARGNANEEKCR